MEIFPYVGVGGIRFGMTPDEISVLMGGALQKRRGKDGKLMEARGMITIIYSSADIKLQEVGFSRDYDELTYRGVNILKDPRRKVLEQLQALDSHVFESYGFLIFLSLGIALTGFHDNSEDDVAVTVFCKDVWSIERDNLKPYH